LHFIQCLLVREGSHNSVIACSRHVRPLCRDHIRHNYVCDSLRSKGPISYHEAGHILTNGLKNVFLLLQCQSNLKFCNKIRFHNTSTHRVYRALASTFSQLSQTVISCNSSVWPTTLICTNFNVFSFHSIVEMTRSRFVFSSKTHSHMQLRCYLPV